MEEEHQTSYYLYSSFLLLLLHQNTTRKTAAPDKPPEPVTATQLRLLACLALHRLACSVTQGGDKWRHLPGLGAWLAGCGPLASTCLVLGACSCLLPMLRGEGWLGRGVKTCLITIILLQKLTTVPTALIQSAYFLLLLLFCSSRATRLERLFHIVTFLSFLLHSPTNLPVLALLLLQHHLLQPLLPSLHPWLRPMAILLLARTSYFQLGGSNSLATVEVAAGYTGLQEHRPVLVCLLLALHTYSGPLLVLLQEAALLPGPLLQPLLVALPLVLGAELTVFSLLCLLLRHHLFVWTVFSPKLLYLGMNLVVVTVTATALVLVQ